MFMFLILVGLMGEGIDTGNLLYASQRFVNTSRLITFNSLKEINNLEHLSLTASNPKENHRDTLKEKNLSFWRKLSYGIGYSSGIGRIVEIQLEPLSPNLWGIFLWNNTLNMNLDYHFNTNWEVKLGIGYLWTKAWIKMLESFNFVYLGKIDLVNVFSPSIIYLKDNKTKIGVDFRLTRKTLFGKEIGVFFSFTPIKKNFTPTLRYNISLTTRFSLGKGLYIIYYKSRKWFDYDVLEIYLKIDFYHIYNNVKTKGD